MPELREVQIGTDNLVGLSDCIVRGGILPQRAQELKRSIRIGSNVVVEGGTYAEQLEIDDGPTEFRSAVYVNRELHVKNTASKTVIFRKAEGWNVLLIRHTKGRHVSFPKGHVEPGETESQTAEREILEETGLRVRVDKRYRAENRYNIRPDIQKLVVIFAAVTNQAEIIPQPEEIAEAFWLPIDEAEERLTYERDRRIMRDAFEHILKYHTA